MVFKLNSYKLEDTEIMIYFQKYMKSMLVP